MNNKAGGRSDCMELVETVDVVKLKIFLFQEMDDWFVSGKVRKQY